MKPPLFIITLCLLVSGSNAQNITIAGESFRPAYTNSSKDGVLKEYLPPNQTLKNWTKLFGVRFFKKIDSPKDYITSLGDEYRKNFPRMPYASGEMASKNRWFVDFIAVPKKSDPDFVEWNLFRAQTNSSGGILVYQYAERRPRDASQFAFAPEDIKNLRRILVTNDFSLDLTQPPMRVHRSSAK